jgi:hypothetical protein
VQENREELDHTVSRSICRMRHEATHDLHDTTMKPQICVTGATCTSLHMSLPRVHSRNNLIGPDCAQFNTNVIFLSMWPLKTYLLIWHGLCWQFF